MRSQLQQLTLCRSLHTEALQATVSERLAQGAYVAAGAEFEPTKASTLPMRHHAPQWLLEALHIVRKMSLFAFFLRTENNKHDSEGWLNQGRPADNAFSPWTLIS